MKTQLDRKFAALADPTRRAILARLARGDATVTELAQPFALSQPAISKHLKVLETAGLIETARYAQSRPRRLRPHALDETADWVREVRGEWTARLARLDNVLAALDLSRNGASP